jgi:predicted nuclease of predicted toxin-antitoxin system
MPTHRLLADEQFPDRVTDRLRANGHDVARVRDFDVNKRGDGKSDIAVLDLAISQKRAIVTLNRKHFKALHDQNPVHFGIISCHRDDKEPEALGRRIDEQIRAIVDLVGQFITVVKKLPEHHVKQQERMRKRRGQP